MAIYNNREVGIVAPVKMATTPPTITVQYNDGSHEAVKTGLVRFTEEEKKKLQKSFPSEYDGVNTISDEDIKAVRAGVAPASDIDRQRQAEGEVRNDEARKIDEDLKNKAKADVNKNQPKSAPQPVKPVASGQTSNKAV